jgi:hypothetical protein
VRSGKIARLRHHSSRPRKRNCNSMMRNSTCARSNPAPPLLGLLVWSLSIRRSAASTRSRARSKSAMVYCRGSGRVLSRAVPSTPSYVDHYNPRDKPVWSVGSLRLTRRPE